ncbi:hypothetical protein HanXRQr2_Chr03g0126911 [Helianthus annuus]|uniref:Uncharacterized protein n=1 Tax=Helianthus annuus TaxID=4232 RepID=A0A9K3NX58_HELAN|nr:hypothetical protein HanXRQr2_Chr03g0126911 [Helianthus annuus]KAJ0945042.1 hypothetical protein HanPSC8_Chr03g0123551 [Helianthus annuus]
MTVIIQSFSQPNNQKVTINNNYLPLMPILMITTFFSIAVSVETKLGCDLNSPCLRFGVESPFLAK